jgi:hypothetical protein
MGLRSTIYGDADLSMEVDDEVVDKEKPRSCAFPQVTAVTELSRRFDTP